MKKIIFLVSLLILASSCKNYLDPYPNADRTGEEIWLYSANVQGLVGYAYDYINSNNRNYIDNEGAYLDGATDNAVMTLTTNSMSRLAVNAITTGIDPFQTYWDRDYKAINLVNLFLFDRRGYNYRFLIKPYDNDLLRTRLQGEAFALRAYFYWDLLQKFGGKGTNGEMLGVPIQLEPSDVNAENNFLRASYDDCVKQIIDDCDSALKYLPMANRDQLVSPSDIGYLGGRNWGRFDDLAVYGVKAMVYLTWASPRFNPSDDIARWDSAAVNAKKVIDFKLNYDFSATYANVAPTKGVFWTDPNSSEIVFGTRYNSGNSDLETQFLPGGFSGRGSIGPTQELVDAFGMKTGYPIDDPANRGLYVPTDPYTDRDPRFYATIFYNKAIYKKDNTGSTWYTYETHENGGKDASGPSTNTRTNYYIKKFVSLGFQPTAKSPTRAAHSKFIIRWAHMLLTFAEAANHVVGPTDITKYGMSARTAIQYLRARKSNFDYYTGFCPAVPAAPDAYLTEVAGLGEDDFDKLVKNERRIETCFEGMRFWDLRRWSTDLTPINLPVHKVEITKTTTGTFTYDFTKVIEQRNFSSAYWPIPYQEILRMSNLVQNEGWDSWN